MVEESNSKESLKLTNFQIERLLSYELDQATGRVLLDENDKPYHAITHMVNRRGITWKPGNVSYWLRRFLIRMQQEFSAYMEEKEALIEEYGVKDETTGKPLIKTLAGGVAYNDPKYFNKPEEFMPKLTALGQEKVDLGFYPIPVDWVNLPQELDPQEISALIILAEPDHSLEAPLVPAKDKGDAIEKLEMNI